MTELSRRLQVFAIDMPRSPHHDLFVRHEFTQFGAGSGPDDTGHYAQHFRHFMQSTGYAKRSLKQNTAGLHKELRAQGYRHKKTPDGIHHWHKGNNHITLQGGELTHTIIHPKKK